MSITVNEATHEEDNPYLQHYLPMMLAMVSSQPHLYWDKTYDDELRRFNTISDNDKKFVRNFL